MSVNLLSYAWTILSYLIIIEEAIMKRVGELRMCDVKPESSMALAGVDVNGSQPTSSTRDLFLDLLGHVTEELRPRSGPLSY
jgi:hypothetical protein